MSTVIQHKELMQTDYPKQIKTLVDSLNDQVKWNFVVRYLAKDAMSTIDKDRFFEWIQASDKSFEELNEDMPFTSTDIVSQQFFKVHQIARQILLPSHEHTDSYLLTALLNNFKNSQNRSEQFLLNTHKRLFRNF